MSRVYFNKKRGVSNTGTKFNEVQFSSRSNLNLKQIIIHAFSIYAYKFEVHVFRLTFWDISMSYCHTNILTTVLGSTLLALHCLPLIYVKRKLIAMMLACLRVPQ